MRQRRREILILLFHAAARERDQHADLDAVAVEMLRAHQRQIGAGRAAVRRIGIGALAGGLHARMRQLPVEPLANMRPEGLGMLLPALREVGS